MSKQEIDKILKFIILRNLEAFFKFFNIKCTPDHLLYSEYVDENLKKSIFDCPVLTDMGIASIEFQRKTRTEDLRRFFRYVANLHEQYKKNVFAIVLDMEIDEDYEYPYYFNIKDKLTIYFKSLKAKNADKTLNRIRKKIENKERLTEIDILAFLLIPFMDLDRKVELLRKCVELAMKIDMEKSKISILTLTDIRNVQISLGLNWNDDEILRLWDVESMNKVELLSTGVYADLDKFYKIRLDRLVKEGKKEGKKEGIKIGKEERNLEIAKDLIQEGNLTPEKISKLSKLDIAMVNSLMFGK